MISLRTSLKSKEYRKQLFSFSQEYDDLLLDKFFKELHIENGFYVDVGAHHPFRYSNTAGLYQKGWRGLNIDANQDVIPLFNRYRPDDITVCAAVAKDEKILTYTTFDDGAVNSLDESMVETFKETWAVTGSEKMQTQRLETILATSLPSGQKIDFMNVDVEGFDEEVLLSNDWDRFRPKVILIEQHQLKELTPTSLASDAIFTFLNSKNYSLIAKLKTNAVYIDNASLTASR